MTSIADDIISIKALADNIFGDLYLCEGCGSFVDAQDTEDYFENHGPGHSERLCRTTCCRSSYTDIDGTAIVDFLGELRELQRPATKGYVLPCMALSQIQRDNIERIQCILETVFDL